MLFVLAILFLVVGLLAMFVALVGMIVDRYDFLVTPGMLVMLGGFIGFTILVVIGLLFGGDKPHVEAGHCYEAVAHGSYMPVVVSTGKTTTIIPMYVEGIDLVERLCS